MKIEFITLSTDGKQTFSSDGKYPLPIRAPLFTAITSPTVELGFQDQNFSPIDTSTPAEVVAISLNTPVAHRAYELGAEFSRQGKIVVYGGPHITQVHKYPEFRNEMFEGGGATSAFIGDAEDTWPLFVDDLVKGTVKEIYHGNPFRFQKRIIPDRETYRKLIPEGFLSDNEITTIESSRGCPNSCTAWDFGGFSRVRRQSKHPL